MRGQERFRRVKNFYCMIKYPFTRGSFALLLALGCSFSAAASPVSDCEGCSCHSGCSAVKAVSSVPAGVSSDLLASASVSLDQVSRTKLAPRDGADIEQWTYPSGKLKVKGRLYTPAGSSKALPLVIFNHDGISGISNSHERSAIRMVNKGYAVFCPSYRGEDGSDGVVEIAKGEVLDVLNALNYLRLHPKIDKNSGVFLMGASHGALISLLAAPQITDGSLKGLIFAYGVADVYSWWKYLKNSGRLGSDEITRRTYGGGPETNPKSFSLRDGTSAAYGVKVPVLILQGGKDVIVPPVQAEVLADALDDAGAPRRLLIYPNSLHGFLVYAPYMRGQIDMAEINEAEKAWNEVFMFLKDAKGRTRVHGGEPES